MIMQSFLSETTMSKHLISLGILIFLAATSWAQEDPPGEAPAADTAAEESTDVAAPGDAAVPEDVAEEEDDDDLDLQTYEEDDDDFVPTEEIPADQPIPFPSNI